MLRLTSFSTTDNNISNPLLFQNKVDFENLSRIANCSVEEICNKKSSSILLFPQDWQLGVKKRGIAQPICSLHQKGTGYELNTGNVMGYVGVTNNAGQSTELKISSRFGDTQNDFFLNYMLAKVCNLNVVNLRFSNSKNNFHDLLIFLFPRMLNEALSQGMYKQYEWHNYNDANVKGPIDVKRHIRCNIPFAGKIAYTAREYSYDNNVTELIRHTIEYLRIKVNGSYILNCNTETKENIAKIISATKNYKKSDLQKVLQKNQKQVSHPYFTKYRPLQILCKMILLNKFSSFGCGRNKIYGVLFDGSWLWEEYIAKVFEENKTGINHKTGCDKLFVKDDIGQNQGIIPDFIRYENKPLTALFLGDTKYKHVDTNASYNRENYFQIITYMYRYSCRTGYLIFPYDKNADENQFLRKEFGYERRRIIAGKENYTLEKDSNSSKVIELGLQIPQDSTEFVIFAKKMKDFELKLCLHLKF